MRELILMTYNTQNLIISLPSIIEKRELYNYHITVVNDNPFQSIKSLKEIYDFIEVYENDRNYGMLMNRINILNKLMTNGVTYRTIMFMDDDDILLAYPEESFESIRLIGKCRVVKVFGELLQSTSDKYDGLILPRDNISGAVLDAKLLFKFISDLTPFISDKLNKVWGSDVINGGEDAILIRCMTVWCEFNNIEFTTATDIQTMVYNRIQPQLNRYESSIYDPVYSQMIDGNRTWFSQLMELSNDFHEYLKSK